MMIFFKCPGCQSVLEVPQEMGGRKGECIVCKASFHAPKTSQTDAEGNPVAAEAASASPQEVIVGSAEVAISSLNALINNFNQLLVILGAVNKQISSVRNMVQDLDDHVDLRIRDVTKLLLERLSPFEPGNVTLSTQHPIAYESLDHLHPRGTVNDNTRWPRFVAACERHFQRPLKYLDLGCAGGGLVFEFLLAGHRAIGLEGSDLSQRTRRAEWRILPSHLFTCDITQPFTLREQGTDQPYRADVISAWEVLEHIGKEQLPQMLKNIREHLADDGIFVASVACFHDKDEKLGINYHVTVEPREWWEDTFWEHGLEVVDEPIFGMHDYCRGIGVNTKDPVYSAVPYEQEHPTVRSRGFHIVLRHRTPGAPRKVRNKIEVIPADTPAGDAAPDANPSPA